MKNGTHNYFDSIIDTVQAYGPKQEETAAHTHSHLAFSVSFKLLCCYVKKSFLFLLVCYCVGLGIMLAKLTLPYNYWQVRMKVMEVIGNSRNIFEKSNSIQKYIYYLFELDQFIVSQIQYLFLMTSC